MGQLLDRAVTATTQMFWEGGDQPRTESGGRVVRPYPYSSRSAARDYIDSLALDGKLNLIGELLSDNPTFYDDVEGDSFTSLIDDALVCIIQLKVTDDNAVRDQEEVREALAAEAPDPPGFTRL